MLNNELLTMIYNSSNGIVDGKNPPISTEKIFNAMRLSAKISLAEALNIYENREIRAKDGIIAHKRIERVFDLPQYIERLIEVYQSVCK